MKNCCHCGEPVKGKIHAHCASFKLGEISEKERKKGVIEELFLYIQKKHGIKLEKKTPLSWIYSITRQSSRG